MIRQELLEILVCPEDHSKLRLADDDLLQRVNAAISQARLRNRGGQPVETPLAAGLVRDDGKVLYAIRDDIPIMLVDESIPLDQL